MVGRDLTPLFVGEARPLPPREGATWTIRFDGTPTPSPVRHALGYEPFVDFARSEGVDARELLDTWRYVRFVRTARASVAADDGLRRAAVIFLGNSVVLFDPNLRWHEHESFGLFLASDPEPDPVGPLDRHLRIERTVDAFLDADRAQLRRLERVIADFGRTTGTSADLTD